MKNLVLALIALILSSCHSLQSPEELLTEHNWYLFSEHFPKTEEFAYYKKSENQLALDFKINGLIEIQRKNKSDSEIAKWSWVDKKQKYIMISGSKNNLYNGKFIIDVKNESMTLFKREDYDLTYDMKLLLKESDQWLPDRAVDIANKSKGSLR